MVQSAFPIITTPDLPRALAFYEGLLGGKVSYQFPAEGDPVYVGLDLGSSHLGIGHADAVDKLIDFQTKLDALATAPKPKGDPNVAQALSLKADEVVACINAIGAA
jgi:catechol 2,3-dioxygenase-like lactoylglutathione lyase family enzyme